MTIVAPKAFCKYAGIHVPVPARLHHYLELYEVPPESVAGWEEMECHNGLIGEATAAEFCQRHAQRLAGLVATLHPDVLAELSRRAAEASRAPGRKGREFSPEPGHRYARLDVVAANWSVLRLCGMPAETFEEYALRLSTPRPLAASKQFRQHVLGLVEPRASCSVQAADTERLRAALAAEGFGDVAFQSHDELVLRVEGDRMPEMPADERILLPRRLEAVSYEPFVFLGRRRGWVETRHWPGVQRKPFGVPGRMWPAAHAREVRRWPVSEDDLLFEDEGALSRLIVGSCGGCVSPGARHDCVRG